MAQLKMVAHVLHVLLPEGFTAVLTSSGHEYVFSFGEKAAVGTSLVPRHLLPLTP